jgi:hypothetical protein
MFMDVSYQLLFHCLSLIVKIFCQFLDGSLVYL